MQKRASLSILIKGWGKDSSLKVSLSLQQVIGKENDDEKTSEKTKLNRHDVDFVFKGFTLCVRTVLIETNRDGETTTPSIDVTSTTSVFYQTICYERLSYNQCLYYSVYKFRISPQRHGLFF